MTRPRATTRSAASLGDLLDAFAEQPDPEVLFDAFAAWAEQQGLALYPTQEEAVLEVVTGAHLILSTPTGSGKSLVALGAHLSALAGGQRTFYTAPIKALVSEKFFALVEAFGASRVGMMTGDASVNAAAPIICCTAEVLANLALREGERADVGQVVMDEFHFYSDPERGWAWQVPLLALPHTQHILMSATLGDVSGLARDLERRTGRAVAVVTSVQRPVPLSFAYVETPVHETIEDLLGRDKAPIYVVHFTQAAAVERAQALTSAKVASRTERDEIASAVEGFRFAPGFGRKTLVRLLRHGIGVHHAGMLPRYRRLVEQLAQAGLLKVICGTDTLGVGINVPIRTVLLTALTKFDGARTRHLNAREFHQIAGRAGRAGFDTSGAVVVQAPEHVVENAKALAKAGDDPRKRRKVTRKRPPDGFVSWTRATFDRLVEAAPETLTSSFTVTSTMLLNVLARPGDPFAAMRDLLTDNHEPRAAQRDHVRRAIALYRELLAADVVERRPEPDVDGRTVRLVVDLQDDFALNQPLAPFAVTALELLDPDAPSYALDVLSVVEAILEDPRQVLAAQTSRAKGEAVAAMKAEGVEYERRMALLEEVTRPRPLAEVLEAAFAAYRSGHPWVDPLALSPKSVARDLYERAMTFAEYVTHYELTRSEGIVLRYLSDAYKALRQTVPDGLKTGEVDDLQAWLGELVRQVDSSLLDEWEALLHPDHVEVVAAQPVDERPPPVTANERAFRVLVRNAMFRRVELAARRRWAELAALDGADGWTAEAWSDALAPYFDEHGDIGTGADARGPHLLVIDADPPAQATTPPRTWRVRQVLDDPEGHHDWAITAEVDLAASDDAGAAVVRVVGVGP